MKKRHIAMLSLGALMACTLGLGVFTACDEGGGDAVKPSEYLDGINYYYGDGNDVHLQGWFVSENNDAWKVEEGVSDGGSTVTKLGFNKNMANNSFSVQIDGEYSDFKYLNITMRAEARGSDRAIAAHLSVANPIPQKDHLNVLGSDLYFDVSADVYTTYTFLVPSVSRQTLDVADYVRLAPDPGIQNTGTTLYTGDIYVKDCWFSKEAPADGVTPVDDTWRTEAWCGYTVTRGGADSEATISYEHPADWSRFYRPVPLEEVFLEDGTVNNMLRIRFTSDTVGEGETALRDSVEQFQVGLWGDPDPTSDAQFWQSWFGQYSSYGFSNGTHSSADTMTVEKDEETGVITLTCQAAPALIGLAGNFEEQLWICFNLESQPQGGEPGGAPGYIAENTPFDGIGQMTILSSEFYYDETMPEYREPVVNESGWSQNGVGAYVISSEKAGVMANVTFDNISPNAWSCLAYDGNGGDKTVAVLTLRNNGTEKVLYGIDWSNEAGRKYGFIEPGATVEVRAENTSASGPINFFLDSCYDANDPTRVPDKEEYSGDVDIVSLTYEEGEPVAPVTPGWSGADVYKVSEENGITNVVYEGVAPSGWTCIAYDTADANGRTAAIITIRNNGTEKVLYGIDWNDQNARVYGFLEAGETKEVRVENALASGPINFFIDSCYDANDPTRLPEKDSYSGNVDILSLTYEEGPAPVVPSDSAWTGPDIYTVSEKDGITNVTYEGVGPQDWTCIAYGVTDEIRRPVVFLTLRNNGEKKMLYGIDLDNVDARVYGYLEPGEIRQLRLESAEAYTVINFFIDSCYYGAPYESYKDSYSGDIDILALEFAAEDEVIDITANTAKVFPTGRVKLTWKAANGADVTVSCTKDGAPAEDLTPVLGEYMTITELGTYVFTFEADGAVTAVWVVRCVERPVYVPDPEPEPVVNDSGWNSSVSGAYTVSSEKAGVIANVTYKDLAPNMWCCVAYAINGTAEGNTLTIQLKNNGEEKVLYGIDWNSEATRQYGYIEPGATAEIRLQNEAMTGAVNLFLDSCYPGYDSSVTDPHSGDVDIVSMEFTNEEIAPPEEPGDPDPVDVAWGVVDNGKSLYTITGGEEIDANVQYSGVSSGLWANLYRDVSADECRPNVKLTLRNNGEEKVLYGAELGAEETRKYGWIEPGQTVTVELNNENVYTVINLFLDCCYQGDYTTDKDTLSGNVDIVSVEFSGEFAPDSEPSALNWTTTAANLSVKDGVVTLNNLMDGAWQNVSADLTLDAGGKITIPVTNNTNAIAKFKLSVMYNNDQGSWSDLEGNGTTVCWLEIPKGETWNMELTVSALDAPKVAHIMLMVACWEKNGTQADGTTPRPEPPYTGTVTIGEMKFTPDATQPPVSEGTVVNVTWGTTAANLSVSEKTVTLNNLPIGTWQNVNADLTLSGACKVTLSITNNTGDVAKFKLQLVDAAWDQIGGDGDPCVCWMEIASGETMELTLTVTAEQAARVAHIMLMVNCWVSGDVVTETGAPCPAGPYTGNIVLGDVKVS